MIRVYGQLWTSSVGSAPHTGQSNLYEHQKSFSYYCTVSRGVGKDERVPFQSRVEQLATVLSFEPADIEGEAKRTLNCGHIKNIYKVAAQKSVGFDFHKTMGECPLYNETTAGQEDKCEKC